MTIVRERFGEAGGKTVDLFTLHGAQGLEARIMTFGGTLVALRAPDRAGRLGDITLGFDSFAPYLGAHPFLGTLVGRYANRIAGGLFSLAGVSYRLACNDGANHLHGGTIGFDKVVWDAVELTDAREPALTLRYLSRDGEEGYPGNLDVTVTYSVTAENALKIDYSAATDQATIVNLTNHAYFNLTGGGDILRHRLQLFADHFLPIDATLIPTGEYRPVQGTVMDFATPTAIGARIAAADEQLRFANNGYDHTWIVNGAAGTLRPAARLVDPVSGRVLEVLTTQPGVQVYSGNFLDGTLSGRGNHVFVRHAAVCLETQHFPDSPNHPAFPSTILQPGEIYRETTVFRCSVE